MRAFRWVGVVALVLPALLVSLTGCGGSTPKKPALTNQQRLAKAAAEKTPDRQAAAYLKAARAQLAAGDKSGASASARQALESLQKETDAELTAPRLMEAARFLAEGGEKKPAREALQKGVAAAETLVDPLRKAKVLAEAGAIAAEKGQGLADAKLGREILASATAAADAVEPRFRAEALSAVALACIGAGQNETAAEITSRLEETARAQDDPRSRAEALAAAATVRSRLGAGDAARSLLAEAAASAKSVERAESRAYAWLAVGQATRATGDLATAVEQFKEADQAAHRVADQTQQQQLVDTVRAAQTAAEKALEKQR